MLRSLRSRLIAGSLLWTAGLLALMHMISIMVLHIFPHAVRMPMTWPVLTGLVFMAAGLLFLRGGLSQFKQLRVRLSEVRTGQRQQVTGQYPTEIQPLVDDLNALLEDRERAIQRALATAGDLAHGLKTPLAVLAQEAERAGVCGDAELAEGIALEVERMRRQVDYHLARARAAASGATPATRCSVAASADGLVRTLLKLHAERALDIQVKIPQEQHVRARREDLDEMLGNLLDNACKWAKSRIAVESGWRGTSIAITVEDDGPGLAAALRPVVLQRGVRADEAAPGSGLGLAIVRDLAELYGGGISLEESLLGGLRVQLWLPAAEK